jgi:hypothetical protein
MEGTRIIECELPAECRAHTPEQFEAAMKTVLPLDTEDRHAMADAIMCELLIHLGYEAGVKVFQNMGKWYA